MPYDFQQSAATGPHARLAGMVGSWEGVARTWFEPDQLADTAPIRGTTRLVLGGRFLLHEYEGGMSNAEMAGVALHGFDVQARRWETAWIDSVHNGTRVMLSRGDAFASDPEGDATAVPDVVGSYPAPPGPDWGWRTTLTLKGPDRLVVAHYNRPPGGATPDADEALAVEIDYRRA